MLPNLQKGGLPLQDQLKEQSEEVNDQTVSHKNAKYFVP